MFLLCVFALSIFQVPWWTYLLLLFGPDISLIGYIGGSNEVGAFCYNIFHHKGIAIAIFIAGLWLNDTLLQVTGIILFGHSSMDRVLGYGLKTKKGFAYTHLGNIGKTHKHSKDF